jgi:uncharacterized membrane protein YphA (DoxX/SURF4 family)
MDRKLWIIQWLLAVLFLMAGVMKLVMPGQAMADQAHLPLGFLHFIAIAEVLGAFGLILPRLFGMKLWLTPLAAAGLVIIMIGATVLTAKMGPPAPALFPLIVGILCAFVAYGRWRVAP